MNFSRLRPFDLYSLRLCQLVARCGSFTAAGTQAGLTQSAVTRQIQMVESRLGILLFERTTRRLRSTEAGRFFLGGASRITGDVDSLLRDLRERFTAGPKVVRIGVSRSVALAHLPGVFAAQRRRVPNVSLTIERHSGDEILAALDCGGDRRGDLLSSRVRMPRGIVVAHRFRVCFCPDCSARGGCTAEWTEGPATLGGTAGLAADRRVGRTPDSF